MAHRWTVECDMCGKKDSFTDSHDITQSRWKIIAWIVPTGEPRVVCDKCEYGKPPKKEKK